MGAKKDNILLKKRILSRKQLKQFKEDAGPLIDDKVKTVSRAELEDGTVIYLIERDIAFVVRDNKIIPTLNNELIEELPNVIVDMGAIPYVCKGADVMSPGIVKIDGVFEEEALIIVRDVNHGKALAIGRAIVSSVDMENMPKGKAINNLHYVGDKIWAAI